MRSAVAAGCVAVGAALSALVAVMSLGPMAQSRPVIARAVGQSGFPVVSAAGIIATGLAAARISPQA